MEALWGRTSGEAEKAAQKLGINFHTSQVFFFDTIAPSSIRILSRTSAEIETIAPSSIRIFAELLQKLRQLPLVQSGF